ncbi:isochorismatase family protein [Mycobacterium aquaticum]|uniref:isochorismatase family protein n=1 Tax=Mycobacterium aquaticum TaxID=1927124 RepID=UPI0009F5E70B|nr:isochorismatase family protein [Mycobacterium aquaticum]
MALISLDPNAALVLVDLQKAIAQAAPAQPVIAHAAQLAEAFRSHGLTVVLVQLASRHGSTAPGRTDMPRPQHQTCTSPSDWHHIVDELAGHPDDILITKRNWGAFYGTDLDLHLRRRHISQIVLGGVATSIGVESTARSAHEHGYHLALVVDAMADLDPISHQHSIEKIFPRLGQITTSAEILTLLAAREKSDPLPAQPFVPPAQLGEPGSPQSRHA